MNEKRCFIAIEIPGKIKQELENLQNELIKAGSDIKLVESDNLHLTLKFLGEMKIEKLEEVKKILQETALAFSPFKSHLSGVGVFPEIRNPRVVWVGIDKNIEKIQQIFEILELKLNKIGFPKEKRSFKTHLTLGRVRSLKKIDGLKSLMEKISYTSSEDFTIEAITFFRSTLSKSGPTYSKILEANFKTT